MAHVAVSDPAPAYNCGDRGVSYCIVRYSYPSATESGPPDNPAARHEGIWIWKACPPRGVKGELDNYDPIGLAADALIKADCSFNWGGQDGGLRLAL
jgi:hypothetical protein